MSPCYEAHITLPKEERKLAEKAAYMWGWVFSEISGCPILGQGAYCYLTSASHDPNDLKAEMEQLAAYLGKGQKDVPVILRMKIEHIVYDSKTGRNELQAPC